MAKVFLALFILVRVEGLTEFVDEVGNSSSSRSRQAHALSPLFRTAAVTWG
ncbi:MAG: hypothetical protein K6C68_02500 [Ruminococcus sp.]|nr:hypothetical protein [Ruminococcus sp.]